MQDGIAARDAKRKRFDELTRKGGVGNKGKDVYKEPLFVVVREVVAWFNEERIEVANLGYGLFEVLVYQRRLHNKALRQLLLRHFYKALQVGLVHGNVYIVVPGYETAMPYRAQQRAAV